MERVDSVEAKPVVEAIHNATALCVSRNSVRRPGMSLRRRADNAIAFL